MTTTDALMALQAYSDIDNPKEDDEFRYTESLGFLIEKTRDPKYMCELAWFYCDRKRFDLEIKYLEMASENGSPSAAEELGYMWYYGQNGEKDYEKAFHYFTKGAEEGGSLWCKYKLADMYRYGCYVDKDEEKYRRMIEEAYEAVKNPDYLNEPYPEICLRLAGIRSEEGKKDEAVILLRKAKSFLAERLSHDPFWGHIEVMGRIVRFLYQLTTFDERRADFYDLFYMTQKPGVYTLYYGRKKIKLIVMEEKGETAISFEGKWYRDFGDFCGKAELDHRKLMSIYDDFYKVEAVKHG